MIFYDDPFFWTTIALAGFAYAGERSYRKLAALTDQLHEEVEQAHRLAIEIALKQKDRQGNCHDKRCPARDIKPHPCHDLDCERHEHVTRAR